MDGVNQIIGYHLVDQELIAKGPGLFRPLIGKADFLRAGQAFGAPDEGFHQGDHFQVIQGQVVVAGLQAVDRHQLTDQLVHAIRLVHDDIQVIAPVLLTGDHIVLQRLGVALDQGDGRLQLMGHAGQKLPPLIIQAGNVKDILLQLLVRVPQFGNRAFQLAG